MRKSLDCPTYPRRSGRRPISRHGDSSETSVYADPGAHSRFVLPILFFKFLCSFLLFGSYPTYLQRYLRIYAWSKWPGFDRYHSWVLFGRNHPCTYPLILSEMAYP